MAGASAHSVYSTAVLKLPGRPRSHPRNAPGMPRAIAAVVQRPLPEGRRAPVKCWMRHVARNPACNPSRSSPRFQNKPSGKRLEMPGWIGSANRRCSGGTGDVAQTAPPRPQERGFSGAGITAESQTVQNTLNKEKAEAIFNDPSPSADHASRLVQVDTDAEKLRALAQDATTLPNAPRAAQRTRRPKPFIPDTPMSQIETVQPAERR